MFKIKKLYSVLLALALASNLVSADVRQTDTTEQRKNVNQFYGADIARFRVGNIDVVALSDGTTPLNIQGLLNGVSPSEIKTLLTRAFQVTPTETSINAFLLKTDNKVILVDTGAGEFFGEVGGRLPQSLALAGFNPADITDILITHIHTDHSGGLATGGKIMFPNATVHVHKADVDFFLDPANLKRGLLPQYHHEAKATIGLYQAMGKVKTFSEVATLFDGITAIPTPGHTPGHSFFRLDSLGELMEFWGDIVHIESVQMPKPDVTINFDVDQDAAREQRTKQFDRGAKERKLIAAPHLNFPGVGYLRKNNQGYDWVPAVYRNRD